MRNYQGSVLLQPVADKLGLQLDQFNFIVVQLTAIICGLILREKLAPSARNVVPRHLVTTLIGIALGHFCYGNQMWHIYFHTAITYTATRFLPRNYIHIILFVFSMTYLSVMHIYRQTYDYGNYVLDITGPIMIITQKVTLLGFAYYDGIRPFELLTADQKSQMIKKEPRLIELVSYIFNFQGIIVGPLCTYSDYIDWITGNNIIKHENDPNNPNKSNDKQHQPSVINVVLKKLLGVFCLGVFFHTFTREYSVRSNISVEILAKPLWYRILYMYFTSFGQRVKYYIAWILADVVNNAAGLGFNGYNEDGSSKWDLVTNVKVLDLESSTSVKVAFDRWNVSTVTWLRRIAYDRMPTGKTFWVFLLSAFWHGFYPGYYLTFVLCAFLVYSGRGIRRKVRPYFQVNPITTKIYSFITWAATLFALNYTAISFEYLDLERSFFFYNQWYWFVQIFVVLVAIILPGSSTKKPKQVYVPAQTLPQSESNIVQDHEKKQ